MKGFISLDKSAEGSQRNLYIEAGSSKNCLTALTTGSDETSSLFWWYDFQYKLEPKQHTGKCNGVKALFLLGRACFTAIYGL